MIYHGTEFADKPTFNELMSDVDFLRFIHFRLTELGDHAYYLHVAKMLDVADKLDRLRAENERLKIDCENHKRIRENHVQANHAAQDECRELREENERLSVGNRRYEIARRLNPAQWAAAFELNIKTGKVFDQIIDELGPLVAPNA